MGTAAAVRQLLCSNLATRLSDSDGPALRALAIIPYANYLLDRAWPADLDYVAKELWHRDQLRALGSVIKNDLEEVGGTWWKTGFDLWEEV